MPKLRGMLLAVPTSLKVLLPLPLEAFSFLLPFDKPLPACGVRVVVPWQSGVRIGIVAGTEEISATQALNIRECIDFLDHEPFILPSRLKFLSRLAVHGCAPTGLLLSNLMATGLNELLKHEVKAVEGIEGIDLSADHWTDVSQVPLSKLDVYRRQGLIVEQVALAPEFVTVLTSLKPPDEKLDGKPQANQRRAAEWLWDIGHIESGAELARQADVPESAVRSLVKKGYLGYTQIEAGPAVLPSYPPFEETPAPTTDSAQFLALSGGQRLERLEALRGQIDTDLRDGKSVLVLAPEQVVLEEAARFFSAYFPTQVLSGDLSDKQRKQLWQDLPELEPIVLVGSYLALLAPLDRVGRVIVLEEGSSSYKLQAGARLFIPTCARALAEGLDIPYVPSSVLPTPETLNRVNAEEHTWLPYEGRRFHISDLSAGHNWPLSGDLIRVLKQVEERKRQAIILVPRRGFSAALGCMSCGWLAMCPNCDLPLRYHQRQYLLQCHQCGFRTKAVDECAECGGSALGALKGAGTQWICAEASKHVPDTAVYQYDSDHKDDLTPLLNGDAGVVVATSAIFRHPRLPQLSLIAMTLFDTVLSISDFRAEEEALRLLLSLEELSERRRPLTLIQTFQPQHKLLKALQEKPLRASVQSFCESLLERRRRFNYPPYSEVAKVQVSSRQDMVAKREADWLAKALTLHVDGVGEVLGPQPAPVTRLKGLYNYQLFVRDLSSKGFSSLLEPALAYKGAARIRIDIDPRDMGGFLQ